MSVVKKEFQFGSQKVIIETGRIARQANYAQYSNIIKLSASYLNNKKGPYSGPDTFKSGL